MKKIVGELPVTKIFLKNKESKSEKEKAPTTEVISKVISRYKTNKDIIEAICGKFDIKTMFVWQPVPVYKYDQDYNIFNKFDYNGFMPYLKLGYETTAMDYRAREFGNDFIWLADMQENLKEPLYIDALHYSAKMSRLIADQIAIALSHKKILP